MEGVSDDIILNSLKEAGFETRDEEKRITKADFYNDGLTSAPDSSEKREILKKKLNLPKHLSTNMLLDVLNRLYGYEDYKKLIKDLFN